MALKKITNTTKDKVKVTGKGLSILFNEPPADMHNSPSIVRSSPLFIAEILRSMRPPTHPGLRCRGVISDNSLAYDDDEDTQNTLT